MNKTLGKKLEAVGMVLLFAFVVLTPTIPARMESRLRHILPQNNGFFTDETLTDWINDVSSFHIRNNRWTIITNSTDIDVQNIDVIQASYEQEDGLVTLSMQVAGDIENRGHWNDWDSNNETTEWIEYTFEFVTSEQGYVISYVNQSGALIFNDSQINLTSSAFTVINDTLSITFPLVNPGEIFENLSVITFYIKIDVTSLPHKIVLLADTLPNYWAKVFLFGRYTSVATKGEYMTVKAVGLWMIRGEPYNQLLRYRPGDIIRISTPYKARIITNHFLFGFFDILEY
ncbi:MAG: hypothetical protein MUC80_10215 [Candidatus Thermoplasmatota archaeon]|jgi:hypothetical protein|nr:hypothetical protein [Candidatus Thermoplasmatota archaeon]